MYINRNHLTLNNQYTHTHTQKHSSNCIAKIKTKFTVSLQCTWTHQNNYIAQKSMNKTIPHTQTKYKVWIFGLSILLTQTTNRI